MRQQGISDFVLPRRLQRQRILGRLLIYGILASWLLTLSPLVPSTAAPPVPRQIPGKQQWVVDKVTPFGLEAALGNRVREDEVGTAVSLMREAGVQWQREEIFWDRVQQEPGGDFTWTGNEQGFFNYDHAIESQVASGIQVLGLLDYNPAWFKGQNPPLDAWLDDWGDFVYASVARYGRDRGWIKHWELWNEPNVAESGYQSGLYDSMHFVRLLEVGYAAAKAADPEAKIVMGGIAGILQRQEPNNYDWHEYLDEVGKAGGWNYVDILAIHFYQPEAPENPVLRYERWANLRGELAYLDVLLNRYGFKPVWITELGWSTNSVWPGVSEDAQAFYLVRAYLLALVHPAVEKIFWYDFRNDTFPNAPYDRPVYQDREVQFHFGLLRRAYPFNPHDPHLRKPSFLAFRTMTNMLAGLTIQQVHAEGHDGVYWYSFGGNGRRVDVLWRTTDPSPQIPITCDCEEALVRNWNGALKGIVYANDGNLSISIDDLGAPIYIEYAPPIATDGEYFAATGHTLRGVFRDFWHQHDGLHRFGYPITEELVESDPNNGFARTVQYFERVRFEQILEHPQQVQISRLGEVALARQGIFWRNLPRVTSDNPDCLSFAETGHTICPPFRAMWEQHGGVTFAGYPLTEPFDISYPGTGEPYTVQYFERVRMGYLPSHPDPASTLEYGLLVRDLFTFQGVYNGW